MKSLIGGTILLVAATGWASADGYKDFNAGVAAAGRFDKAEAIMFLSHALSAPDLPEHLRPVAYLARSQVYYDGNQYDSAIADLDAALRLDPNYVDAYIGRCAAHGEKGQLAEAIADCSNAVRLEPQNWQLRDLRVHLNLLAKHYDAAIADYSEFISARPGNADLLLGRSEAFRQIGQLDRAWADAKAAHDLASSSSTPYLELALIECLQGKLSDSLSDLRAAMNKMSNAGTGLYLLKGLLQWAMGRYSDAADSSQACLGLDQTQVFCFLLLSLSDSKIGKDVPTEVSTRFSGVSLTKWPGPLLGLFLGKTTPQQAEAAAHAAGAGELEACEADFNIGEWQSLHGNATEAKRLLSAAAVDCPAGETTREIALLDAGRLP